MISFKDYLLTEGAKKGTGFGCLMLMFTNDLKKDFLKLTNQIDEKHLYKPEDGYGRENEPHVTVKYGLHENDHDIVFQTLGKLPPVPIKFKKKVSLFENEKFDVVKLNISGSELRALNKRVSTVFECTDTYPNYQPHATVAYVQPGFGNKYLDLAADFMGEEFEITRLCFSDENSDKKFKVLK